MILTVGLLIGSVLGIVIGQFIHVGPRKEKK